MKPKISFAATPASSAVARVPTVASEAAVPSTGRISGQPEVMPPSKRIRTSAIVPSVRASSSLAKSIPPIPSEPASIPSAEEEQQPGDADAVGEQRPGDARGQQDTGDQDQLGVVVAHRGTL